MVARGVTIEMLGMCAVHDTEPAPVVAPGLGDGHYSKAGLSVVLGGRPVRHARQAIIPINPDHDIRARSKSAATAALQRKPA